MPSKRCATSAKRSENCSSAAVTNRMACQSRCEIQVQASHWRILTACSRLSTARNRAVWGLDCRSAGRLLKRITDDCGRALTCHVALSSASLRLLIRPPHREWSAASDLRRSRRRVQQAPWLSLVRRNGTITGDAGRASALGNATWAMWFCRRQLQLVGHARQVRQGRCPHLTHYLATMNFYRDFAYAEVGCDLLV